MKENKTKPDIRFKGFTEAWEQRKFSEVAQRQSETMVSDDDNPCVEYEDVISEQGILNKDIYSKGVYKNGIRFTSEDVLYGKLRPYLHNWLNPDFTGVAVGDWWVLKPQNTDKNFLFRLIQTAQYDDAANQSSGTKMPRADWKLISNMEFQIPSSIDEQAKIAGVFDELDNLITLHQRECDQLKELKKSMLKKMFPRDGSSFPEVRFAGFTDAWEQRKLKEITDSYSGGTPSAGKKEYYDGSIPFIRSGEISDDKTELFITEDGLNNSSAKIVHEGDILYALYGATSGEVSISKLKGAINQAILAIQPHDEYNRQFLMQWLRKSKDNIVGTYLQGGQGNLSGNIIKELIVNVPTYDEQNKIGEYSEQLDNLITLHQRELEILKNLKKTCLKRMFI